MFEEEFDSVVPPEDYWSPCHSMALHRFGLDWDVYDELVDEEWESYEEDYCDDFEALYEDDQA